MKYIYKVSLMCYLLSCLCCAKKAPVPNISTDIAPNGTPNDTIALYATKAPLLRKIVNSTLDFRSFEYNTKNQLTRYYYQYIVTQGTTDITNGQYEFKYLNSGELIEMTAPNQYKTKYINDKGHVERALLYNTNEVLINSVNFFYNNKKQLTKLETWQPGQPIAITQTTLSYTETGNLQLWKEEHYDKETKKYYTALLIEYSDFDNKPFLKYAFQFNDYLIPFAFWVNNPGKKQYLNLQNPIEKYTYSYNQGGLPVKRTTTFEYSKPLPTMIQEYQY